VTSPAVPPYSSTTIARWSLRERTGRERERGGESEKEGRGKVGTECRRERQQEEEMRRQKVETPVKSDLIEYY
jgi:hypothetical protein